MHAPKTSSLDQLTLKIFIYLLGGQGAHVWMSEENLEESVLSFHQVGPKIELKFSGLVANAFPS